MATNNVFIRKRRAARHFSEYMDDLDKARIVVLVPITSAITLSRGLAYTKSVHSLTRSNLERTG